MKSIHDFWDLSQKYTRIKLCEFESLDPAYEAAHLGAHALGFHIFKHQPFLEKAHLFKKIFEYIPSSICKTLLTDLEFADLQAVLKILSPDAIQLSPDWDRETLTSLRSFMPKDCRLLKVMSADLSENRFLDVDDYLNYFTPVIDGILLDSKRIGGTGAVSDWGLCARVVQKTRLPVMVAGGLRIHTVKDAILKIRPFGVDVENGVSVRIPNGPLVKNMHQCSQFIQAVTQADQCLYAVRS